jgi:hypothetical protein
MNDLTNTQADDNREIEATAEQLAELRRLGIREQDLVGLTSADAEEWIDELRAQRIDAQGFSRS